MNTILVRFLSVLVGYAFGLIQTAYIYGKMKGIDIRQHGSGNAGTTNVLRTLGTKAGIIVFFGDQFKALFAVKIVQFTFGTFVCPELKYLLMIYAGIGVVLAHDFPPYLHFRGGKGIAATSGLMLGYHWLMIITGLVTFFGTFVLTHFVSLGSIMLYLGFVIALVIMGQSGWLGYTDATGTMIPMAQPALIEAYILAGLMLVLTLVLHRANIGRLIHGCERKTYLFKKNKEQLDLSKTENKNEDDRKAEESAK